MLVLVCFLTRFYHWCRARSSRSIVMQHQLNYYEVGSDFEITEHTAQLLTYLFFAMTFASGLPLMMPLCCFAYMVFFRVDKMLLCRFYKKPPHFGDGSIRMVVTCLPFAAILVCIYLNLYLSFSNIFSFSAPRVCLLDIQQLYHIPIRWDCIELKGKWCEFRLRY